VTAGAAFITHPHIVKASYAQRQTIIILHTNDVHSHIDPFPANHNKFPSQGGFAARSAMIQKIRQKNEHVLLLDSGDIFQGTPYFNYYGGRLELELMTRMGYDAATMGNHEFDNGVAHLSKKIKQAGFPFINSNYDVKETALEHLISPWKIIQKGNIKIGLIGLGIQPDGLIAPSNFGEIKYLDPIIKGETTAALLKHDKKCNMVIALSHLGLKMDGQPDDITLARETKNIDMILGGHTHTFLEKPMEEINLAGHKVTIHQSGWAGVKMEQISVIFEKGKTTTSTSQLTLH
jgi:5'-nucleotidase